MVMVVKESVYPSVDVMVSIITGIQKNAF